MTVTVIIPVFNRAVEIRCAVASVLRQRAPVPLDVLVIDDGSDDDTPQVLADLAAADSRVRTIRRDNGGISAARNTGLDNLLAETEFVTFLDSDDLMAPDRFVTDLAVLIARPEVAITYGNMVITFALDRDNLTVPKNAEQLELTSVHLACCLYRRSLIETVGRFDDTLKMAEDTDYIFRTFEIGVIFVQTETVCHYYLRHPGNISSDSKDNQSWFARAVARSVHRRKKDPSRKLVKPDFNIELQENFFKS